ncbi:FAD/NAD-P-binding domain-containing protein [Mycena rebaudengoi]|nr:FAD/NAD-P-binding domain-containing protein [Mycena rebaudengoi]KAJ7269518.1 FAD/NAD-P-binding domain-containing protein [Mycena rebaudengoi]
MTPDLPVQNYHPPTMAQTAILFDGRKAKLQLKILIVGAGIAGLSAAICLGHAGHTITVVEGAAQLTEVGAGIQVGPNMSRLLIRWGLGETLNKFGVKPASVSFRRYSTGERVGFSWFGDEMESDHGTPYYHMHRADLLKMLCDKAAPFIDLRLGSKVVAIDTESISVTLASGEAIFADVIIGADGVKSLTRSSVSNISDAPLATGDAVYRALIPTSEMLRDPLLRPLVEVPEVTCWMGPGKHVVGYCIRANQEYNLVMVFPDKSSVESWTTEGNLDDMRSTFEGWEPRIERLLGLVRRVLMSKIVVRDPLVTWTAPNKRITLIGDACHPMLPYRAQGSAMAIEDAAVLGNLFSRIMSADQIGSLLEGYEKIRIERATSTHAASITNRRLFHLPDGDEQQKRDDSMRSAMPAEVLTGFADDKHGGNANMWADRAKNFEQFSYDADEIANNWWRLEGSSTCRWKQVSRL